MKYEYYLFKNVNFPFLQDIRFYIFSFTRTIAEVIKEAAISLRHLGKSILEGNLYLGPLEILLRTLEAGMTFRLPVITCPSGGINN